MERYTLNPKVFSLQLFYELTRSKKMIPSRLSLHEGIGKKFKILEARGIENLQQLIRALGNKQKIAVLSAETKIPTAYLILLKREAGSYLSKSFPLSDFPGIPLEYTEVLKSKGIKNTREFFESVQTAGQRKTVSGETGIPDARLREIFCLCDLSRITGVGAVYARIIYHAGIKSLRDFAKTAPATHNKLYKDLLYCINYATLILELSTKS